MADPEDELRSSRELYADAERVADVALKEAHGYAGNIIVMGIATQILLATVLKGVGSDRLQEFRNDLSLVLKCAPEELNTWLEMAYRVLPGNVSPPELGDHLLMSAVTRSTSIRDAAIALTAASIKLADLVIKSTRTTQEAYERDIADDVREVAQALRGVQAFQIGTEGKPN